MKKLIANKKSNNINNDLVNEKNRQLSKLHQEFADCMCD